MALTFREWRLAKEISQDEMAKACGVHVHTYQRWEADPGVMPIKSMKLIAEKLDISEHEIIFLP